MTHVTSWTEAISGLLGALDRARGARRVLAVAILELVVDEAGAVTVVLQHGVQTGVAVPTATILREFSAALQQAADAQADHLQ